MGSDGAAARTADAVLASALSCSSSIVASTTAHGKVTIKSACNIGQRSVTNGQPSMTPNIDRLPLNFGDGVVTCH
ncbi:hypothetical protein SAMN05216223_116168 [Actinacidiphila yanglinensis]|uniref:Uncharacterized protein n=1 Tax=Actinacidiphila yanglinensis TaxID=310779 RepID=A0A1H6DL91_9ACTN|nr:hypothetical protein SAMN05216223_116168 [Actinacidiphila yanglinensis]